MPNTYHTKKNSLTLYMSNHEPAIRYFCTIPHFFFRMTMLTRDMLKQTYGHTILLRQRRNKNAKNISTENFLLKEKTFLTCILTGVNSKRRENKVTRNKFASHYDARSTSECSVRRLKTRSAAGWWHVTVSVINIPAKFQCGTLKSAKAATCHGYV